MMKDGTEDERSPSYRLGQRDPWLAGLLSLGMGVLLLIVTWAGQSILTPATSTWLGDRAAVGDCPSLLDVVSTSPVASVPDQFGQDQVALVESEEQSDDMLRAAHVSPALPTSHALLPPGAQSLGVPQAVPASAARGPPETA